MVVAGCWNRNHQYGGLGEVCWMRLDWLLRVEVGETKMSWKGVELKTGVGNKNFKKWACLVSGWVP